MGSRFAAYVDIEAEGLELLHFAVCLQSLVFELVRFMLLRIPVF